MSALEIGIENTAGADKNRNGMVNRHVLVLLIIMNY